MKTVPMPPSPICCNSLYGPIPHSRAFVPLGRILGGLRGGRSREGRLDRRLLRKLPARAFTSRRACGFPRRSVSVAQAASRYARRLGLVGVLPRPDEDVAARSWSDTPSGPSIGSASFGAGSHEMSAFRRRGRGLPGAAAGPGPRGCAAARTGRRPWEVGRPRQTCPGRRPPGGRQPGEVARLDQLRRLRVGGGQLGQRSSSASGSSDRSRAATSSPSRSRRSRPPPCLSRRRCRALSMRMRP